MTDHGCDDLAVESFMLLAQMGDEGRRRANELLFKVKGKALRNPSAFVHKSVVNARQEIKQAERAWSGGAWASDEQAGAWAGGGAWPAGK
ncbi:MAG TPA: hypothetical protein EYP98_05600 [Planctomycetes bacterium]|nr:hypothetical protein [Planctomycetota bacterium]